MRLQMWKLAVGVVCSLPPAAIIAVVVLTKSHATGDVHEDHREEAAAVYQRATASMNLRTHARILDFFGDFTLVDPGLVKVTHWRPEEFPRHDAPPIGIYGAVARKEG